MQNMLESRYNPVARVKSLNGMTLTGQIPNTTVNHNTLSTNDKHLNNLHKIETIFDSPLSSAQNTTCCITALLYCMVQYNTI